MPCDLTNFGKVCYTSDMQTINISITDDQKGVVDQLVAQLGFANRSELFRTVLRKIKSSPQIIKEPDAIQLSPKAIKRYNKMIDDIESGKVKTFTANNTKELMDHLMKD